MKQGAFFRKFLFLSGGLLFCAAAVFGVYLLADAALSGTLFPAPGGVSSAAPLSSAQSSQPVSAVSSAPASSAPPQSTPLSGGLFAAYAQRAQKTLAGMTLREKVGQVFLFRCPDKGGAETAAQYRPGGYFLMASHFEGKTAGQVRAMLRAFQAQSRIPMALAVDEEGGTVVRVSRNKALSPSAFQSPQAVFGRGGMEGISDDTVRKADFLRDLGLNLNLAPVADVSVSSSDFIYARSFGKNAAQTAEFVKTSVRAYNGRGFSCTLKHFPGYGNNRDTHTGIAVDTRSLSSFRKKDFLPFSAGIEAGAPCVLVSHNIVKAVDPQRPASLSPAAHRILREELGFTGLILTDDLIMGAIREYTGGKNPCAAALNAGNDLLLSSNIAEDFNALYAAVQSGTVARARLDESVLRVLAWKYRVGILS